MRLLSQDSWISKGDSGKALNILWNALGSGVAYAAEESLNGNKYTLKIYSRPVYTEDLRHMYALIEETGETIELLPTGPLFNQTSKVLRNTERTKINNSKYADIIPILFQLIM